MPGVRAADDDTSHVVRTVSRRPRSAAMVEQEAQVQDVLALSSHCHPANGTRRGDGPVRMWGALTAEGAPGRGVLWFYAPGAWGEQGRAGSREQ